jgi:hypothetical protein
MSYWFVEPHTLVLAGAQIVLCNPREGIGQAAIGSRRRRAGSSRLCFWPLETETLLGL